MRTRFTAGSSPVSSTAGPSQPQPPTPATIGALRTLATRGARTCRCTISQKLVRERCFGGTVRVRSEVLDDRRYTANAKSERTTTCSATADPTCRAWSWVAHLRGRLVRSPAWLDVQKRPDTGDEGGHGANRATKALCAAMTAVCAVQVAVFVCAQHTSCV